MADRGSWESFENWAEFHNLNYESPDVQEVYYSWIEIFSSEASWSNEESVEAFRSFLELSGFDEDEIEDILETYVDD